MKPPASNINSTRPLGQPLSRSWTQKVVTTCSSANASPSQHAEADDQERTPDQLESRDEHGREPGQRNRDLLESGRHRAHTSRELLIAGDQDNDPLLSQLGSARAVFWTASDPVRGPVG
jgi:hypothetical protein